MTSARWALSFYGSHFLLVAGLSLVASAQRFVFVGFGDGWPSAVGIAGEILTAGVRILLLYAVVRLTVSEPGMSELSWGERWGVLKHAIDRRSMDFLTQFLVPGVGTTVFAVLPNIAIETSVPEARQDLVTAVLLMVKNPTIIAFTMLWSLGVARMLIVEERLAATASAVG
jgi:hypothetical protein